MLTESCEKKSPRFSCRTCDYFTDSKCSFYIHLLTSTHPKLKKINKIVSNVLSQEIKQNKCEKCNKKCSSYNNTNDNDIIMKLLLWN